MSFDIEGARKEGYSDAEIVDHLARVRKFDAAGARKEGYSDAELLGHLSAPRRGSSPSSAPAPAPVEQPAAFGIYPRSGRGRPTASDSVRDLRSRETPLMADFASRQLPGDAQPPVPRVATRVPVGETPNAAFDPQATPAIGPPGGTPQERARLSAVQKSLEGAPPFLRGIGDGVEVARRMNVGAQIFAADMAGTDQFGDASRENYRRSERTSKAIGSPDEYWARAIQGGIASLVGNVQSMAGAGLGGVIAKGGAKAAAAGASRGALTTMGTLVFGDEYQQGREAGLDPAEATARASIMAAAEVIGERFGLERAIGAISKAVKGVSTGELPAAITRFMLSQQGGEQLTLALQSGADKFSPVGINPEMTLEDYLKAAADTVGATLVQTAAMGAGAKALSTGAAMARRGIMQAPPLPNMQPLASQNVAPDEGAGRRAAVINAANTGMADALAARDQAAAPAAPTEPAIAADAPDLTYQNRDRSTAASVAQMQKIAQRPDYDLVGTAKTPDVGAPLVAADALPEGALGAEDTVTLPDGTKLASRYAVVEADSVQPSNFSDGARNPEYETAPLRALSNARTAGIRAAYPAGNAADYRAALEADTSHGVPAEQIRAMRQPMLVRVLDRKAVEAVPDFARQSNTGGSAQMGARETAVNDAQAVGALDDLQTSEDGAINVASNRPFIRRFVGSVPERERAAIVDKNGALTPAGEARIRNAIVARAYGNSDILARLTESADSNIRSIGNGLVRAAPDVARLRDAIAAGRREPLDIAPDLAVAVEELARLRAEGIPLEARLAQGSLVDDGYTPEVVSLLQALDSRARSAKQVAEFIRGYVDAVESLGDPNQGDMLGKPATPSRADILRGQDNELRDPAQQAAGAADEGAGAGAGPGAASLPGAVGTGGQAPGQPATAGGDEAGAGSVAESRAFAALDRATAAAEAAVKAQEKAQAEAEAKEKAEKEKAEKAAAAKKAEAEKPKPKLVPKEVDPFADDYAALNGKTVTDTVRTEDGKAAKLKMDAGRALRAYDKRLKTLDDLRTCLRGAA
jgi:hypothetical protein